MTAKRIMKKDTCIKFHDESQPLYMEIDASSINLGTGLLQLKEGMNCEHDKVSEIATLCMISFTNKSLLSMNWYYSNIEWEGLGILHEWEKFFHYSFSIESWVITHPKPLIVIINNHLGTMYLQYKAPCCALSNIGYTLYTYMAHNWHGSLVIPKQPCKSRDQEITRHEHKCVCYHHISKYTIKNIIRSHTASNLRGCRPPKAKIKHNTRLSAQDRWSGT